MVILFNAVGSRVFNLNLPTSDLDICAILKDEDIPIRDFSCRVDIHNLPIQLFVDRLFNGRSSIQISDLFGEPIIETQNSNFILETKDEFFDINKRFYYDIFTDIAELYLKDFDKYYTKFPKCLMIAAHYYRLFIEYTKVQNFTEAFYVPDSEKEIYMKIRKGELSYNETKKFVFELKEKVEPLKNFYVRNPKSKKYNLEWIDQFLKLADYNADEILQNFYAKGFEIP